MKRVIKAGLLFIIIVVFLTNCVCSAEIANTDYENTNKIISEDINTTLTTNDFNEEYLANKSFTASLTDNESQPLKNKEITFTLKNPKWAKDVTYNTKTNEQGISRLLIELYPGEFTIISQFKETGYQTKTNTNKITIIKKTAEIRTGNLIKVYEDKTPYQLTLKDLENKTLANKKITITITSEKWTKPATYTLTTNTKGEATLPINLYLGEYMVKSELNDKCYKSESEINKITITDKNAEIRTSDLIKVYEDKTPHQLTLKDLKFNPLANKQIIITITSEKWTKPATYTLTTNTEGEATLPINLYPGEYMVKSELNDEYYKSESKTNCIIIKKSVNSVIESNDLIKVYGDKTPYQVTLKDLENKTLANKQITITITSTKWTKPATYTLTTNTKGEATLPINLYLGKYLIKADLNDKIYDAKPIENYIVIEKNETQIGIVTAPIPSYGSCPYCQYAPKEQNSFKNFCSKCDGENCLKWNPKGVAEGEWTCTECDCDFCAKCGFEKQYNTTKCLTKVNI